MIYVILWWYYPQPQGGNSVSKTSRRRDDTGGHRFSRKPVPTGKQVLIALSGQNGNWLTFEEIMGKCPNHSWHSVQRALSKLDRDGRVERDKGTRCTTSVATTTLYKWRIKPGKEAEVQKLIS